MSQHGQKSHHVCLTHREFSPSPLGRALWHQGHLCPVNHLIRVLHEEARNEFALWLTSPVPNEAVSFLPRWFLRCLIRG